MKKEPLPGTPAVFPESKSQKLYTERSLSSLTSRTREIARLHEQKTEHLESRDVQRLLSFENRLGKLTEKKISMPSATCSLTTEYFLTPTGKTDFFDTTGIHLSAESLGDMEREIFQHRLSVQRLTSRARADLASRSQTYRETSLFAKLLPATHGTETKIELELSDTVIITNPAETLEKLTLLKKLKKSLQKKYREKVSYQNTPLLSATYDLLDIYQKRINLEIASLKKEISSYGASAELLPTDELSEEEQALLNSALGISSKSTARYNKFTYGASEDTLDSGNFLPFSTDLKELADAAKKHTLELNAESEAHRLARYHIDQQKVERDLISPQEIQLYAEELLRHYGVLSKEDPTSYTPGRGVPAKDGGWQVIVHDRYRSMAVNKVERVIKIPNEAQRVDKFISITLAHEIEGHVLQNENREHIPLYLVKSDDLGSGRAAAFSECGAMQNQSIVSRKLFGTESIPHPHYLAAMEARTQGGALQDCVLAFYESVRKLSLDPTSTKAAQADLKLAINRTLRIFRGGDHYTESSEYIDNSKDLVYLEQAALYDALEENNLTHLAYLSGANLETLAFLYRYGLIEDTLIRKPDFYCLTIWDKLKERFSLSPTNQMQQE